MKRKKCTVIALCFAFLASFYSIHINAQSYTVYPIPQKMSIASQTITLTTQVNVVVEDAIDETILQRMKEVLEKAGHTYVFNSTLSDNETNLLIGVSGSGKAVDNYAMKHNIPQEVFLKADNKFDSHVLQLNNLHKQGDIIILGNSEGSAYYAFATLEQLLEQAEAHTLQAVTIEDYAYVKMRGIVEGFYGHTYSMDNRMDLFDYCKRYKLNTYFYGPKSDPYHAGLWRDNYPETITEQQRFLGLIEQGDIRRLAAKAKACHIDFIWSIHPALAGGGIDFSNLDPGVDEIMEKFQHMYELGIRHFGVSIDDMQGHPRTQHELAEKVQQRLIEKYNSPNALKADKVGPLLFVPSQYALNFGTNTLHSFQSIHKDIEIIFTGYDVFSNIRESSFNTMKDLIGRKPVMWWNNPVNDDHDDHLYMHGLTARWTIEQPNPIPAMEGLIMNPMNQAQASKICLFGAADYAWNPSQYVEDKNWHASLKSILKEQPLYEALAEFINAMSSYSLNGTEEQYAPLYDQFKKNYSKGKMPDTTELLNNMSNAHNACILLQTLRESNNKAYRLFYEDIAPWLNKIEAMTDIVCRSIKLMGENTEQDEWNSYAQLLHDIAMLHKDPKYFFSVLEGSGTDTYDTSREAQPTPNGLNSFIDFLGEKITELMPKLPPRSRNFEIITNQPETVARLNLIDGLTLQLNNLTLAPDDFIGINLNSIKKARVDALPKAVQEALIIEWSINGKDWTPFTPDGQTEQEMVYIRFRNNKGNSYTFPVSQIHIELEKIEYRTPASVRTNMSQYQNNVITHVIDNKEDTKFWSNREQQTGDFIEIDYDSVFSVHDIELYFAKNDRPTGTASIQLSNDAMTWETIARFKSNDIKQNLYACNAQGKSGRYIRLYIEQVKKNLWFQLTEFKAKGTNLIPVATDNNGNGIDCFDDRSLAVGYQADSTGYILYRFTENLTIDEVQIYHNSRFDPSYSNPQISVMNEGKWIATGELNETCTIVPFKDYSQPSLLKIEWNDQNIPSIYEIYVKGTPFMKDGNTDIVDTQKPSDTRLYVDGMNLTIQSSQSMTEIILLDTSGAVTRNYKPNSMSFNCTCTHKGVWLLILKKADGNNEIHKFFAQ